MGVVPNPVASGRVGPGDGAKCRCQALNGRISRHPGLVPVCSGLPGGGHLSRQALQSGQRLLGRSRRLFQGPFRSSQTCFGDYELRFTVSLHLGECVAKSLAAQGAVFGS